MRARKYHTRITCLLTNSLTVHIWEHLFFFLVLMLIRNDQGSFLFFIDEVGSVSLLPIILGIMVFCKGSCNSRRSYMEELAYLALSYMKTKAHWSGKSKHGSQLISLLTVFTIIPLTLFYHFTINNLEVVCYSFLELQTKLQFSFIIFVVWHKMLLSTYLQLNMQ